MYPLALNSIKYLTQNRYEYFIIPQNIIEFWRTCTRPFDKNGLGMTVETAKAELENLESLFTILPDCPAIYGQWRELIIKYEVMGVNVQAMEKVSSAIESFLLEAIVPWIAMLKT